MILYHNAHVWINNAWTAEPAAILVQDELIKDIFFNSPPPLDVQRINLHGAYVYPGFIDTHTHSFEGGLYSLGVDLSTANSIEDVLGLLAHHCRKGEDALFAWQLDETQLTEKRFPTMAELDKVITNRPLVLRRIDGHSCVLNSNARKLLPELLTSDAILRGAENDQAVHYFHKQINPDTVLQAYQAAAQIALKGGFTGIHTMIGDARNSIGHYGLIEGNLNTFPITYTIYPQSFNFKAALDAGATRIGGCILADGSIGSMTAALLKPYEKSDARGVLYKSDRFWADFITHATKHNLQVAVHCIGDRAIKQINDVYKSLPETPNLRHQLIHCELTNDSLIEDIKLSGAVPVMQPNFDLLWGGDEGFYTRKLGLERSRNMNRFASLMNKGIRVCGGSDWYITALNAPLSIKAAMNHHNPLEQLSHVQAVNIYTKNAAWLSNEEEKRGAIRQGYFADFTVLDRPLDAITPVPLFKVKQVICKGVLQYESA